MKQDKKLDKQTNQTSIQTLQQKQTQLQAILDSALKTSKDLESRSQRRKYLLDKQAEDAEIIRKPADGMPIDDEEYDDELIEFQKIESELRISELNRQLNVIQEELRMKLYRRLLFNTNVRKRIAQDIPETNQDLKIYRPNSCPDDTTPPSSSCSDETATSTISTSDNYSNAPKSDIIPDETDGTFGNKLHPTRKLMVEEQRNKRVISDISALKDHDCNSPAQFNETVIEQETEYLNTSQLTSNSNMEKSNASESTPMTPTASRDSGLSSSGRRSTTTEESPNIYSTPETVCSTNSTFTNTGSMYTSSPTCFSHYRNSSANSDLERIEEDEEDIQGLETDSPNHFRTIHEEKMAPITHINDTATASNQNNYYPPSHTEVRCISGNTSELGYEGELDNCMHYSSRIEEVSVKNDREENFVAATAITRQRQEKEQVSWSNRPLTLYLPKPNEKIDLVEHIQALGHDLNVIANDITIDSTCASGYLRKQSSKNSRRWLKKFFHFDRSSKTLCYYENEACLTKKKPQPKNCIPFTDIYDVYVDHIRSGIGKKDLKSTKHHYIFVLSTAHRKYSLASHKTETMRAWIDILFTAAQVNEYFE